MNHRYWLFLIPVVAILTFAQAASGSDAERPPQRVVDVLRERAQVQRAAQQALAESPIAAPASEAQPAARIPEQPTVTASSEQDDERREAQARTREDTLDALRLAATYMKTSTYKAVYGLDGSDNNTGKIEGTLTLASEGDKNLFGISGSIGPEDGSFIVITNGGDAFLCIEGQGDSACLKTHAPRDAVIPLPAVISVDEILDKAVNTPDVLTREVESRTIAGRDGRCIEVVAEGVGMGVICLDEQDNLVLLIEGHFWGSKFNMQLQEFAEPTDRDFDPPFMVTELP